MNKVERVRTIQDLAFLVDKILVDLNHLMRDPVFCRLVSPIARNDINRAYGVLQGLRQETKLNDDDCFIWEEE